MFPSRCLLPVVLAACARPPPAPAPVPVPVTAPLVVDAGPPPDATPTWTAITSDPRHWDGVTVTLSGSVVGLHSDFKFNGQAMSTTSIGGARCTLLGCGDDNPCCNRCSGEVSLQGDDRGQLILLRGPDFGCGGDECNVTCTPAEGPGTFTGVLHVERAYEQPDDLFRLVLDVTAGTGH